MQHERYSRTHGRKSRPRNAAGRSEVTYVQLGPGGDPFGDLVKQPALEVVAAFSNRIAAPLVPAIQSLPFTSTPSRCPASRRRRSPNAYRDSRCVLRAIPRPCSSRANVLRGAGLARSGGRRSCVPPAGCSSLVLLITRSSPPTAECVTQAEGDEIADAAGHGGGTITRPPATALYRRLRGGSPISMDTPGRSLQPRVSACRRRLPCAPRLPASLKP